MKRIILNKKTKIISTAILFVVVMAIVIYLCLSVPSNDDVKLSTYKMDLTYNDESKTISGNEEITFINNYNNMFTSLKLHLYPNAFREGAKNSVVSSLDMDRAYPNDVSYGMIEILSVTSDEKPLDYVIEGEDSNILNVSLPLELYPDESVTFSIEFEVSLANINHRLGYGNNTINIGNFYPIVCVYEEGVGFKTDLYHSNGDPFYSECANYDVTFTYPSTFTLASSGQLMSSTQTENQITSYMEGRKIRDFCLVLSNIFQHTSTKVEKTIVNYYGYENDSNIDYCLQVGTDALKTFNNLFGEYPYSQLSIVKSNFVHGGMEYPNLVLISDEISQEDLAYVIVHEIAHQWWYGVVGNDENNHAWMDEGLAEYSTLLFFENNASYGEEINEMLDGVTLSYKTFVRVYRDVLGEVDTSMDRSLNAFNTEPEYVQCTYTKGTLLFNSIRESVGDKKFFKALKDYYQDYSFKNVKPEEMIASFIKSTGYNLESFIYSWINGEVEIY